jgi:hypothetical protein
MRPGFIRDLQDPSCCSPNTAGIEADASASLLAGSDGRRYPGRSTGTRLPTLRVSAAAWCRLSPSIPKGPLTNNPEAIQRVLEAAGVEFIAENGGGPGVRLRKAQQTNLICQRLSVPTKSRRPSRVRPSATMMAIPTLGFG